jgi:hypothetical protein
MNNKNRRKKGGKMGNKKKTKRKIKKWRKRGKGRKRKCDGNKEGAICKGSRRRPLAHEKAAFFNTSAAPLKQLSIRVARFFLTQYTKTG